MASLLGSKAGRACAAALIGLLAVPFQAWGVGLSSPSPSLPTALTPPTSVLPAVDVSSTKAPSVVSVSAPPAPSISVSSSKTPTVSVSTSKALAVSVSAANAPAVTGTNTVPASHGQDNPSTRLPSSGFGSAGGKRPGGSALPVMEKVGRHRQALPHLPSLRATVHRLEGCLVNLPTRLRRVLELRTGVDATRAFGRAAVARLLHIGIRQVSRLERRALRQLRSAAHTHSCGAANPSLSATGVAGSSGPAPVGEGGAIGEVRDVRYVTHTPRQRLFGRAHSSNGDALLGIKMPPDGADTWLLVVMIIPGVLLLGFLFGDERRRSHWLHRPPR